MSIFWTIRRGFRDAFYDVKYGVQRWRRGYSDVDLWNLCDWFYESMNKMLPALRKKHHGYPVGMTNEEYEGKLDSLIKLLPYLDWYNGRDIVKAEFGIKDQLFLHSKEDAEAVDKRLEEKKNEFFKLFSELFYNLWD